jgi:hypothetical protein
LIERLTAVPGIGRWTAEMYLMFRLDHGSYPNKIRVESPTQTSRLDPLRSALSNRTLPARRPITRQAAARRKPEAVGPWTESLPLLRLGRSRSTAKGV